MRTSESTPLEKGITGLADTEAMEELHHRENNGIAVSLLWNRHSGRLSVLVEDSKEGASFALDSRADNVLEVFYHPYAHAGTQLHVVA